MTNRTIDPDPIPGTDLAAYRAWQRHVDAGRIPVPSEVEGGNRPPPDPAILANTCLEHRREITRTQHILRRDRDAARSTGGEA